MKERPILFSGPMVRALLNGSKTQTRRVVKGQAPEWLRPGMFTPEYVADPGNSLCPYGAPGDRLWVRETWGLSAYFDDTDWLSESIVGQSQDLTASWRLRYAADYEGPTSRGEYPHWRPSIHMPRWVSRLTLEVTEVRIERVQDISEAEAIAEGVIPSASCESVRAHVDAFEELWCDINGAESWSANPWVWVVSFKAVGQ